MPVVFDPRVGSSLIGHLAGAITGSSIARKTSFLLGKRGEQIFARGITIRERTAASWAGFDLRRCNAFRTMPCFAK